MRENIRNKIKKAGKEIRKMIGLYKE